MCHEGLPIYQEGKAGKQASNVWVCVCVGRRMLREKRKKRKQNNAQEGRNRCVYCVYVCVEEKERLLWYFSLLLPSSQPTTHS